jgi:hypothetical protein
MGQAAGYLKAVGEAAFQCLLVHSRFYNLLSMKAVQFTFSFPRYGLGLALGRWFPGVLWSELSCTVVSEVPEPNLPGSDW